MQFVDVVSYPSDLGITCEIVTFNNGQLNCNGNDNAAFNDECIVDCLDGFEANVQSVMCDSTGNMSPEPECNRMFEYAFN